MLTEIDVQETLKKKLEEGPARSRVAVLDPIVQLGITGRTDIEPVATEARQRLERALSALPSASQAFSGTVPAS